VYLFPGLGAYLDSVFGELGEQRPELGEVFGEIDAVLRETGLRAPISPQLFVRRPPSLEDLVRDDPDLLQLALFGVSAAVGRVLLAEVGRPPVLVGHSLGEIAALTAAGALSVRDGAYVVAQRNAALRTAGHPGGMLALGGNARRVSALVELMGDPGIAVAAENSPRQTVVSGSRDQLLLAEEVAGRVGIGATRLHSPYPFHSPLLAEASEVFERSIRGVRQAPLRIPVYSPISGRCYHDGDDLPSVLAGHLTLPVRFLDALRHVHGEGADVFVECGARNALSGLVAKSLPEVVTVPCLTGPSPVDSLRGALSWLNGDEEKPRPVPGFRGGPGEEPRPDSPAASSLGADRGAVLEDLRVLYAEAVEYPVEVFTEDVDLEADLGVDSVKQTELLARVAQRYGMPERAEGIRVADFPTLGRIADLVVEHGTADPAVA
jgi:acyl transferase domain-containing protein/acyl carrier protein